MAVLHTVNELREKSLKYNPFTTMPQKFKKRNT